MKMEFKGLFNDNENDHTIKVIIVGVFVFSILIGVVK